jgi:hypothetical protein
MATIAQIEANRENARHSTGPRTEEGKAASSQNALKHGLRSDSVIVLPGEEQEFEVFRNDLFEDLNPHGAFEGALYDEILIHAWNLRRCHILSGQLVDDAGGDPRALISDENDARLRRLDIYVRRTERAFYRAINELRRVQTERAYREESSFNLAIAPEGAQVQLPSPLREYSRAIGDFIRIETNGIRMFKLKSENPHLNWLFEPKSKNE